MAKAINQNDLTGVINSALGLTDKLIAAADKSKGTNPKLMKQLRDNYKIILGKDGILEMIANGAKQLETFGSIKVKIAMKTIDLVFDLFERIIQRATESKYLSKPISKIVFEGINSLTAVIKSITGTLDSVKKLALWSLALIVLIPLALIGLLLLVGFVALAGQIFTLIRRVISTKVALAIILVDQAMEAITKVVWRVLLFALLTPIIILAVPIAIIGLLAIILFTFVAAILFKLIVRIVKSYAIDVILGCLIMTVMIGMILMVGLMLVIVGLLSLVLVLLIEPLLKFLIFLIVAIVIIGVIGIILSFLTPYLTMAQTGLRSALLLMGTILLMAIMLLLIGLISSMLNSMVPNILIFMVYLVAFIVILGVIGVVLSMVSGVIAAAVAGLSSVLLLVGSILGLAIMLLVLGKIELDFDKILDNLGNIITVVYAIAGVSAALIPLTFAAPYLMGTMGTIVPIVGMVYLLALELRVIQAVELKEVQLKKKIKSIFSCVETVISNLKDGKRARELRKLARKNKRMLRQVRKVIDQVGDIAETLNEVAQFKIHKNKIIKSLQSIFDIVDFIEKYLKERNEAKRKAASGGAGGFKGWWNRLKSSVRANQARKQAMADLGKAGELMEKISSITDAITSVQDIKINDASVTKIKTNIDHIFKVVDNLQEFIRKRNEEKRAAASGGETGFKGWWNRLKNSINNSIAQSSAIKELGKAGELMGHITNIVGTIESVQSIKIDKDKVKTGIEDVFNVVDELAVLVQERNKPTPGENFLDRLRKQIARQQMSENMESVTEDTTAIGTLMSNIKGILEALESINNVKNLRKEFIKNTVTGLFDFVDELALDLAGRMSKPSNADTITKAVEFMDSRSGLFDAINSLNDSLSKIEGISKMTIDKNKVQGLMTWLLNDIPAQISNGATLYNESISDAVNLALDDMERINEVLGAVQSTPEIASSYKKIMEANTNFLGKINTMKLENLKTAANIFEQMAKFSESISGDFEGLADTLNDKIAPLMEELKELLDGVQKKVEKSGSDISASVFASKSGQLNSSEMANQTAREMPNSSDAEREQETRRRMEAQARQQNSEIVSKLAELIDLFEDGRARVKPVM